MPDLISIEEMDAITVYIFHNSLEVAIDAWFDDMLALVNSTPPNQPFRVLMDVSSKQVHFSRYARQKSKELFSRLRDRKGRYAFLFSSPTAPYYTRIFFASLGRLSFEMHYFTDSEKALAWLKEG